MLKIKWNKKAKAWALFSGRKIVFRGSYEDVWFRLRYFNEFPEELSV